MALRITAPLDIELGPCWHTQPLVNFISGLQERLINSFNDVELICKSASIVGKDHSPTNFVRLESKPGKPEWRTPMFRTQVSRFVCNLRYWRITSILGLVVFAALQSKVAMVPAAQDGSLHRHANHSELLEHQAVNRLVEQSDSTHVAVQSGLWTTPETWRDRNMPGVGAKIWIPAGVRVTLASSLLGTTYDWIRVDGSLLLRHDRDTGLKVVTLVVGETGSFEIGGPKAGVRP